MLRDNLTGGGTVELAIATAAVVHLDGQSCPLDLTRKAARLLAEGAALVQAHVSANAEIVNLG